MQTSAADASCLSVGQTLGSSTSHSAFCCCTWKGSRWWAKYWLLTPMWEGRVQLLASALLRLVVAATGGMNQWAEDHSCFCSCPYSYSCCRSAFRMNEWMNAPLESDSILKKWLTFIKKQKKMTVTKHSIK